jgi:hypothetical protein
VNIYTQFLVSVGQTRIAPAFGGGAAAAAAAADI